MSSSYAHSIKSGVSQAQPQHYWRLGMNYSWVWVAILCTAGCLSVSSAIAPAGCDNKDAFRHYQMFSKGRELTVVENHSFLCLPSHVYACVYTVYVLSICTGHRLCLSKRVLSCPSEVWVRCKCELLLLSL